jgi:hypothetical protein
MDHLPEAVRQGLADAQRRALRKSRRLRVSDGERTLPVLHAWERGFAVKAETAARLRGLVDLFDGERHLARCLIVASRIEDDEMLFEFKHATKPTDRAPADFELAEDAPVALLPRG